MAFNGYYIKVNGTTFPNSLIASEGYSNTPNQRTDKNSYVDGRGALHRNILPEQRSTVELTTIDGFTYGQKLIMKAFFIPRDVITMEYWNDETDAYETGRFYVPDIKYTHKSQDKSKQPIYNALNLTFIEYEGDQ
jgi:hypothetical protein